jgi:acyl-CoA thioesterase YciA
LSVAQPVSEPCSRSEARVLKNHATPERNKQDACATLLPPNPKPGVNPISGVQLRRTLTSKIGLSYLRLSVLQKIMPDSTHPHAGEPLIRAIAMPADANPSGDIFGGWLMSQMDLAAANAASRRCRGRCATVAVDGMIFHRPVFVGDEVSLYCRIERVGRTSMTIRVEAWRRSRTDDISNKVTEATFTFVATDEDRKPRPVPPE